MYKSLPPSLSKCLELVLSSLSLTFTRATHGYEPELAKLPTRYTQAMYCLLITLELSFFGGLPQTSTLRQAPG